MNNKRCPSHPCHLGNDKVWGALVPGARAEDHIHTYVVTSLTFLPFFFTYIYCFSHLLMHFEPPPVPGTPANSDLQVPRHLPEAVCAVAGSGLQSPGLVCGSTGVGVLGKGG